MSLYDYQLAKRVLSGNVEPSFASLIMAAYSRADTGNAELLHAAFPSIIDELRLRVHTPGGVLESDPPGVRAVHPSQPGFVPYSERERRDASAPIPVVRHLRLVGHDDEPDAS